MKVRLSCYKLVLLVAILYANSLKSQFLVEMIDTAARVDKGLWAVYKKADHLLISGYFQPQFQVASEKGIRSFSGGDFAKNSNNRFTLRRGRIRFDYAHFTDDGKPQAQVVFQFDGNERGVNIRDFWGRFYENRFQLFAFTAGMFARPFGYEVNLSSGDRETPERGRMSQTLMRTERDLGVMATLEPRKRSSKIRLLKVDLGVFNGQGLTGPEEYDSYKDVIARISVKPISVSKTLLFSGGASIMEGGIMVNSNVVYRVSSSAGKNFFQGDSSSANFGTKGPRKYREADAQFKIKHRWGATEIRGEYWWGLQTSGANESITPGTLLNEPYFIRHFNGGFFYFLQNIFSDKHQIGVKYDFYDPNTSFRGTEIGSSTSSTHSGDIRFHTLGFGYTYWFNKHVKCILWYERVVNETTALSGYTGDVKDNVFTARTQFRF